MIARIAFLVVMLQCSSSTSLQKEELKNGSTARYMKYVSGAGGGKGIIFKVRLQDSLAGLEVVKFRVNDVVLPAIVNYENGQTIIEASKFYSTPRPDMDAPEADPLKAKLFLDDEFHAVIHFKHLHTSDSLVISDFREIESPLYP